MKGHIHWRGERVARLFVDAGRDPITGRRRQLTRTVRNVGKREADAALRAFIAELEGTATTSKVLTVERAVRAWYAHVVADLEPHTATGYRSKIDHHIVPILGPLPLARLTPDVLDRYYHQQRTSGAVGRGKQRKGAGGTHAAAHK